MKSFIIKKPLKLRISPAVLENYLPGYILVAEKAELIEIKDCFLKIEKRLRLTLLDDLIVDIDPEAVEEINLRIKRINKDVGQKNNSSNKQLV